MRENNCSLLPLSVFKALTNATNIINEEVENLRSLTFSELKTELNVPTSGNSVLSPATPKILHVGQQEFSVSRSSCFVTNKIPAGGGTATVNESLIGTTITVSWVIMQKSHHASSTTSFSAYGYAAKS